jgi:hypothetical protein
MSYLDTFTLTSDASFQGRVIAASSEQALIFVDDARPEFVAPAQEVILSTGNAYPFVSLVAGQPGITALSTDADILAALQAVWPKYGAALINDAPVE